MIWLTWRQFRVQAVTVAAALVLLAVAFAVTGTGISDLYAGSGMPGCHAHGTCDAIASNLFTELRTNSAYMGMFLVSVLLMYAMPPIIGVFWGAPLVTREIETGTFRLAWTQSVTRNRWLAVKLGMLGLAAMATAGLLSLMTTWWSVPLLNIGKYWGGGGTLTKLTPALYATRGIVPIGYAAFGFALGVAAGVLIRRTLPAMVVTLAGTVFAEGAMPAWIRGHLIPPLRSVGPLNIAHLNGLLINPRGQIQITPGGNQPSAWALSAKVVTAAGRLFTGPAGPACRGGSPRECNAWIASLHLRQVILYQPASRYWPLQGIETGLFVVLALALAGFCAWWLGRRQVS